MRKLILFITILFSLGVKAQDTTVVCIPTATAKQIVKDLLSGDSAKAVLVSVEKELSVTKDLVSIQKLALENCKTLNTNLGQQVSSETQQKNSYITMYQLCESQYKDLSKKYKLAKFTSSLKSAIGIPLVIGLGILYILK
jgi:hypothetical protein